jgi:hypothetical protein
MSRHERLEDLLRAEAGAFRARSRTGLAGRTIERVRDGERMRGGPHPMAAAFRAEPPRRASWLAVAAAVLLAGLAARAWLGGRGTPAEVPAHDAVDAELIVRPLGRLLALDLGPVEDALKPYRSEALVAQGNPLESEARKLWLDASRAAQEFASQLPSPLREALIPR